VLLSRTELHTKEKVSQLEIKSFFIIFNIHEWEKSSQIPANFISNANILEHPRILGLHQARNYDMIIFGVEWLVS
jgi:hypothetical protein